jgi:hypothetical protein
MRSTRSRTSLLISLSAAAGAFGAAAMMSAATAPTARADDFTDVINAVEGDFTAAQAEFGIANTDFGGADYNDGLAAYFSGVDDDVVGAPGNLSLGTAELIANDPVTASLTAVFPPVSDFTSGLTEAQSFFTLGGTYFGDAATELFSGDYVDASYADYLGSLYDVASGQVLIESVVAALTSQ